MLTTAETGGEITVGDKGQGGRITVFRYPVLPDKFRRCHIADRKISQFAEPQTAVTQRAQPEHHIQFQGNQITQAVIDTVIRPDQRIALCKGGQLRQQKLTAEFGGGTLYSIAGLVLDQ